MQAQGRISALQWMVIVILIVFHSTIFGQETIGVYGGAVYLRQIVICLQSVTFTHI